ncbi:MAG: CRISP-associated protein Cas1, partial [Halothiobacillaceae bacterium]
ICLPDEVNFFRCVAKYPRPMAVARDEALPLYVQAHKTKVAKTRSYTFFDSNIPIQKFSIIIEDKVSPAPMYIVTPKETPNSS